MYWLFISVILYAFNNILWKVFVEGEHPLRIIYRRAIFTVLIGFIASWITDTDFTVFIYNPKAIYVLLASLFGAAGLVMMVTFLREGSLVRMGYYSLLGGFIAASYTYLFRETPITPKAIVGSIIIIVGYLVFLFDEKRQVKTEPALLSQHFLLAGMVLCFSISLLIQWESLKIFHPLAIICTQEAIVLIVTFIASLLVSPSTIVPKARMQMNYKTAIMAIVIFAGIFTGTLGLKSADPFLASITGISVPVLTVIAGNIVFRDRLNLVHLVSLLIMITGGLALL